MNNRRFTTFQEVIERRNECDPFFKVNEITADDFIRINDGEFAVLNRKGLDILCYMQDSSYFDNNLGVVRNFVVKSKRSNKFAAFFGIKLHPQSVIFDGNYVIELSNFVVNYNFRKDKESCIFTRLGIYIFDSFITPMLEAASIGSESIGYFVLCPNNVKLVDSYAEKGLHKLNPIKALRLKHFLEDESKRIVLYKKV